QESRTKRLPRPKKPLPDFQFDNSAVETTLDLGSPAGQAFTANAPKGGVLVGLRVVCGSVFGRSVQGVEPIFQVGNRYVGGGIKGVPGNDEQVLLAPPGFAVGGVEVASGLLVDAIRLVYMPVDGKKLDSEKLQLSEWVGGEGGNPREII